MSERLKVFVHGIARLLLFRCPQLNVIPPANCWICWLNQVNNELYEICNEVGAPLRNVGANFSTEKHGETHDNGWPISRRPVSAMCAKEPGPGEPLLVVSGQVHGTHLRIDAAQSK